MEFQMSREIYQMQCHLLNNLRKEGKFCDVIIQTNQGDGAANERPVNITAHSCILSATSFIFYKNFTVNQTTENQNSLRIFSRGVKPEIWELVLEYIYLRKMTVSSGLSKENLCSLFWLLRELHLINEVEYKKILQGSCKIFGFDIMDSCNDENYAVRFEQVEAGHDVQADPQIPGHEGKDTTEKDGNEKQVEGISDDEEVPDDMDDSTEVMDDRVEQSNEPQQKFSQEPQHVNLETQMHLPVYEDNGANRKAFTGIEGYRQDQNNQVQSGIVSETYQGDISGGNVASNALSNTGFTSTSQGSGSTQLDYQQQTSMGYGIHPGVMNHNQPTGYRTSGRSDIPPVANQMIPDGNAVTVATQNRSEGNTMDPQVDDPNVPAGESVRRMADWINQSSSEEIRNSGMGHGITNLETGPATDAVTGQYVTQTEQDTHGGDTIQSADKRQDVVAPEAGNLSALESEARKVQEVDQTTTPNTMDGTRPEGVKDVPAGDKKGRETQESETASARGESKDAFVVNDSEGPDANDVFKSEWERLAGNFAFKNLCRISVLGKDGGEQAENLPHPDLIKKERDLGYENDNPKEQEKKTKGKKQRNVRKAKKVKKVSSGPWYSCSDCDQRFSTYVLFQKHQCNSNLVFNQQQAAEKPGKRSRKKRKSSNTDKWLPKPITIVPDHARYSSDIENYSNDINGVETDDKRDGDSQVALVSFGGKATYSDDTDVDETYRVPEDDSEESDGELKWSQNKRKSKRKFKVTRKKKDLTLLRKKKRGRPFGSKNKKVKPLKVKLEVDRDNVEDAAEEDAMPKKRKGRPKGSKNKVKVKVEGEEEDEELGSDGEVIEKPKRVRKRKRSGSEKPSPVKTPRAKLTTIESEELKGGTVEGTGENPALSGRVARVFDVCNLCGDKVPQGGSKNLRLHQKTACRIALSPDFKDRPKNICPFCDKQLSRNSELNIHIKIHHMGGHPYKCRLCPEEFNTRDGVKQHMITIHDVERIKCSQCNKVFLDARNYHKHFRYCGPDGPINTAEKQSKGCMCHICGHVSVNEGKNRVHLLYHKSPAEWDFHCEVCNQAFAQKSDLKKHRMIHTGEKPYLCDLCPYATNRTSNLKLHMRKHTAERSEVTKNQEGALVYKCIECTSTFSLKTELKDHLKVHDTKQSRCFKKFRPRTKEDMQQKAKKPAVMRKHRPKYPARMPEMKKDLPHEESNPVLDEVVPTVVRDITMASLGPMAAGAAATGGGDEGLVGMGLPSQSRAGMIAMNPHVTGTDTAHTGGMMGIGPGPIGTEARMMGYLGMAHYGQAGGERLIGMSGEMPVMEDRMMQQIRQNVGAVDERMHRIRNEESMLGYALRNNMPETAYMNL